MAQPHQSYASAVSGQGGGQPTYDQLVDQVTQLTALVSSMQTQPPPPPPQPPTIILDKIKMPTPEKFSGASDGDSIRAFIETVDNYFDLVKLTDTNLQARFVYSLLTGAAVDWFRASNFDLARVGWAQLRAAMKAYFQPADWERVCLTKLQKVSQGDRNIEKYIHAFNIALNRCGDTVPENIALHLFEVGLSPDLALQVYNARCTDLQHAQQVAQSASLALNMSQKNKKPFVQHVPRRKGPSAAHTGQGSGGGYKPMDLGSFQGKQRVCYNCGKPGHFAKQCPHPKQDRKKGANNNVDTSPSQEPSAPSPEDSDVPLLSAEQRSVEQQCPPAAPVRETHCNPNTLEPRPRAATDVQVKLPLPPPRQKACVSSADVCFPLLKLNVSSQDCHFKFLVDSGATHSFISRASLDKLPLCAIKSAVPLDVVLADGSVVPSLQAASVEMRIQNTMGAVEQHTQEFRIVEQLNHDAILGMDWLCDKGPKIDWRLQQVCFPAGSVHYGASAAPSAAVELCSLNSLLRTVQKDQQEAWIVLLRETDACAPVCDATLATLCANRHTSDSTVSLASLSAQSNEQQKLQQDIASVCDVEFPDVFGDPGMPPRRELDLRIDLKDESATPPRLRQFRLSHAEQAEVAKQVEALLAKGWIRPSVSPYGHPILFVRKKTGELRMCIDFRSLNRNTTVDKFPLPRIADLLDKLGRAQYFTSIDLSAAYHQLRIADGHEHKTAFITPQGLFEYVVMPFGLVNAPSSFQRAMHATFGSDVGQFVLVYLDDILIFSETAEQHVAHVRHVLTKLRANSWYAKRAKCVFAALSVKYLGHIVGQGQVAVDPAKTDAIHTWPAPTCLKDVQQFLGLANYYNQFIDSFAHVAAPLTSLLSPKTAFSWGEEQQTAFEALKYSLCNAPVLKLPDWSKPFVLQTDASDHAVGGVLLQEYSDGLHPVCYHSHKYLPAERNYSTGDKELLAIYSCCMKFRPYIDQHVCTVHTDHKPLVNLRTQPFLSQRQARWVERLEGLDLNIVYTPGKLNVVADVLSRKPSRDQGTHPALRPEDVPRVAQLLRRFCPQYSVHRVVDACTKALKAGVQVEYIKCQHCSAAHLHEDTKATAGHLRHTCNTCHKTWTTSHPAVANPLAMLKPQLHGGLINLAAASGQLHTMLALEPSFLKTVWEGQQQSSDREMASCLSKAKGTNGNFVVREQHGFELVYKLFQGRHQLVIPRGNGLRQQLVEELHSSHYAAHPGVKRTLAALQHRVWWPKMGMDVARWVKGCHVCQRVKDVTAAPQGLLQPLPVASKPFQQWTMDFITELPVENGHNALFVCVDKFSKMVKLLPIVMGEGELSAAAVATHFFELVVKHFGLPESIVSDRDPRFTSSFWQALWEILGTKLHLSSAYHPQSDGQTERANRTVEQCVRALGHEGKSWLEAVPLVEFALNTTVAASTGVSPFFCVFGQDVRQPIDLLDGMHTVHAAQSVVTSRTQLQEHVRDRLLVAQQQQKRHADKRRRDISFDVGDKVWLSTRNLKLHVPSRKFADRFVGPFRVITRVGEVAYRLDLTTSRLSHLHPVFHVSLLRGFCDNGRGQTAPPIEVHDEDVEWEVSGIVGHRTKSGQQQFLVAFAGFDDSENRWMSAAELSNASDLLAAYRTAHGL